MKKIFTYMAFFLSLSLLTSRAGIAQKKVSELTLVYDASVTTGNKEPKLADAFDGSTTTVYLKGNMSRTDMQSALASFSTIHDANNGTSVVLQEVSGQKLLIRMTAENWKEKNRRYDDIVFTSTSETKQIVGYNCMKAIAKMKDGTTFTVYYTRDLLPENQEYNYQFRNLDGLPLEYEFVQGAMKIRYTVSRINMNPVPASKFDVPKTGYREMTYNESRAQGPGKQ